MKNKLVRRINKLLSSSVCRSSSPNKQTHVDVCEEYANAFRTESYIEFWTRVVAYSNGECRSRLSRETTTSTRLPSYRLFAEHLLDPDQPTVTQILAQTKLPPEINSLLSDYFSHTANASLLCSQLLKDIDGVRIKYKSLKTILQSVTTIKEGSNQISSSMIATNLIELSLCQCSDLQKQLELSRDNLRAKLQMVTILKHCSTCAIVVVTTSLVVLVVSHGFALLVAMPGLTLMNLHSKRKLTNATTQLDAAAKGTYILNKDLETTSRLVARLNDEMEHIRKMVKFWLERKEDKIQADGEVLRLLKKNQSNFSDQLDELEEHLYLCFMTINRARDLVLNQITASA
ncbi:UPF0496 protein [Trifolium repens]|nr:UPF0496 protein [Trifolium repens]